MRSAPTTRASDWRDNLPPYGTATAATPAGTPPKPRLLKRELREPRRARRAAGWLLALAVGAAVAAFAVYNMNDPRSLGTQLDDTVANVRGIGTQASQTLADSQNAAAEASRNAVDGVGTALTDAAISAKIKTALAADPALKASRITVTTTDGVVRLEGPAPDETSRQRATVLAGAPRGVHGVDNRLALPQPGNAVVPVNDGVQATVATPAPAPQATPDAAATARVQAALATDVALAKSKISVSTQQGIVRLEGVVTDPGAKERALTLAAGQPGVKSVDNRLLTSEAATLLARTPTEP